MHTGYDNYWMYQNRRQELVLCSPKNDNFSRPVFTNNYKQMQGTGHPNNLGNYMSPPNTVPRSHHKVPQDQQAVTGAQSMWPSSVCLQPYTTSLTHNFISNNVFSVLPNNICDSSEPTNQVLRNVQNSNINLAQAQSTNYKASADPVNSQNNNYRAQTARIRVKDVFSLNNNKNNSKSNNKNNNKNNIPSLLNGGLCQTQQKKQHYCPYNSATFRNGRMYSGQTQRECYDSMTELNHLYLNYGPPATHFNMQPPSASFYQQNAQCTYENQLCYNSVQQIPKNLAKAYNQRNYQLLGQEPTDSDKRPDSGFKFSLPSVAESNQTNATSIPNRPDLPENMQQTPCPSFISYPCTEAAAKSPLDNPVGPEIGAINITVPDVDEVESPDNRSCSEQDRNCERLPSLGASSRSRRNSSLAREDTVVSLPVSETCEGSTGSPKSSVGCSVVQCLSEQEEAVPGGNVVGSKSPRESVMAGTCEEAGNNDAVCRSEAVLRTPKVEKFDGEGESFEDVESDGAALQVIKTEVDVDVQDCNAEQVSEVNLSESTEVSDVDFLSLKKHRSETKTTLVTLNGSQESEMREYESGKAAGNGNEKSKTGSETQEVRRGGNEKVALLLGGKYKSEINRDKLDLLIKFLKKEEGGPGEIEKNWPPTATNPTKEYNWKQNRRKLSKTCVVKNKNTEREMVSLVSYKTPKCSSKSSAGRNNPNETPPEIRTNSIAKEKRPQQNGQGKTTPENCSSNGKSVTTEERNIINIMRAFQNLKNHFCASCDFASPVESIWINVVSGELRCLNCFKKMMSKTGESPASNMTKSDAGVNASLAREVDEDEKSSEKKSNGESKTKSTSTKPEELKGDVKKEVGAFENVTEKESSVRKSAGKEQRERSGRPVSEEQRRAEAKSRGEEARRNSAKEQICVQIKKEAKETVDSPERCRKRNNSAEELSLDKVEEAGKDAKQKAPRVEKSVPKESGEDEKNKTSEEVTKKSRKEEPKRQHSSRKSHKVERARVREEKKDHASEKHKRKRVSSDEEVDLKKIRIVQENGKGEPREKSKTRRESKEDGHKTKAVEKGKEEERKARKNGESKQDSHNRNTLSTTTRLIDLFAKLRKKTSPNERHQGKPEAPKAKSPNDDGCHLRKRLNHDPRAEETELMKKRYRKSKQYLISRLFKAKQSTKVDPRVSTLVVDQEAAPHKMHQHRKRDRIQEEAKGEKHSEKRKTSAGKPTDGRKRTDSRKDKAVGCSLEEIIQDVAGVSKCKTTDQEITYSTALLDRLMKKTKKLSWSLLGEA